MYELIFTIIVLTNGKLGFNQTMLQSFNTIDDCIVTREYVEKEMLKTAKQSNTLPGLLECRRTT